MSRIRFQGSGKALLALAGVLGITACSGGQPNSGKTAGETEKPPVVKILMSSDTPFPDDNAVVQEIRKKTGVNVQFIVVNGKDLDTKLNTMIASNDIPDIFKSSNKAKIKELVTNDIILPLDGLLQSDGKNIMDNIGSYLKGAGYIDGKTYALPGAWGYGRTLAIRKDWTDKLGLKVPTTIDEYYETLKAFVNNDPDGNGKKDTIGLGVSFVSGTLDHIFGAYGVPYDRPRYIDGKLVPWVLQPGFLDAVKFLNKLYKEGLMEPEFATIPNLQEFEKLWNGKIGAFEWSPTGLTTNWVTRYKDPKPDLVYTVIKGPKGEGGSVRVVREDLGPWTHIAKSSKNPAAAMKVLNFLISEEGDRLTWAGLEGQQYKLTGDKFEWIPPYDDAVQLRNVGGFVYNGVIKRMEGLEYKLLSEKTRQGVKVANDNPIPDAYLFEVPEIEREMKKVMTDLINEHIVSMIVSGGNLDQQYEEFKKKYLASGGQQWIDQATAIYKKEQSTK